MAASKTNWSAESKKNMRPLEGNCKNLTFYIENRPMVC